MHENQTSGSSALDGKLLERGFVPWSLTSAHRRALDTDGFIVLEGIISPDWLAGLRHAFDEIHDREGDKAGEEVAQMEGLRRLADLINKGSVFDAVYLQPELLTAVYHVLQRPFKLHSLNGHDPLPGSGLQILHADWGQPAAPCGPYHVVNSMWMLDDFTRINGATRCVPGSHRIPGRITDHIADRLADHPDQVYLTGSAGSVAVFNGSLWHSSYVNRSDAPRRALHCAFIAREHPQQTNQREYLQAETAQRLSPLARYVLDVEDDPR
ncbi:MAG: phytanoyl-CoA dioxygenase family protein [Gemmatimonadetes bacterium]|nr:phytanoyl-CoA dioxygenase family protein [Gemmatimonadota bacterium]MYD24740.1 phytanoyl-CoA dioxygenase family protein [Gemmatimonadota bacterium]MYI99593.1 phytanoyl-CoA dioxygenase family protein [Gemmatimonadota bacterium]